MERWERPIARRLLQFLLLDPTRPVAREELIDALFPALDAAAGANALGKAISMARGAIGRQVIESTRDYVRLARPVVTDLEAVIEALEAALERRDGERIEALEAALAHRGEPIPEERYADWPEAIRSRLAELRRRCAFELAHATSTGRPWAEVAAAWENVLSADPTNEQAAFEAIQAYAVGGERMRAASIYETCRLALP